MKYGFVILALLAQGLLVAGQILLKQAMSQALSRRRLMARFACAIGCMTVYFFMWLAIARTTPLSQLAPFDALGPVFLVAAVPRGFAGTPQSAGLDRREPDCPGLGIIALS